MAFTKHEIRVGLFIVIPLLIILILIIFKLGYSIASSTMDVYLKTDTLTSVKEGTPIKIKGYPIGRVVEMKPVYKPALHFLATLRINRDIELYEDCSAIIQNQNIIGDAVIEFRNPELRGKPLLEGDVLEGVEVVNLETLLGNVNSLISNLNSTVSVIKGITSDSRHNLKSMVTDLAGSMANLRSLLENSGKDLGPILGSLRETTKNLSEISNELKKRPLGFIMKGQKDTKDKK